MANSAAAMNISDEVMIRLDGVNKWYGQFHVLKNINLTVKKGERIVVCGPSGSGKSTMIRCINRLEEHQKGHIVVDNIALTHDLQEHRACPARGRHGVPALQSLPASYRAGEPHAGPHLGAQDAEGGGREGRHEIRVGADPEQAAKYPGQLSGGQQQRVAWRSLCMNPKVMLFDERPPRSIPR
jgi:general L-amino acid transport system ATP-binding protein